MAWHGVANNFLPLDLVRSFLGISQTESIDFTRSGKLTLLLLYAKNSKRIFYLEATDYSTACTLQF